MQAEDRIRSSSYEDLGYAKIDIDRKRRTGNSEVVFCEGKPNEYLANIYNSIYIANGEY